MKRMGVLVFVVVALAVLSPTAAVADIPTTNRNANVVSFACTRGSEQIEFQAVGIAQSAAIAGQVLTSDSVVVFVRLIVDGQVIFEVPGQVDRSDIWSCEVTDDPGVIVDVLLTPRR